MINLLPPERSQSIRYGRLNGVLLRWIVGLGAAILGLLLVIASGWLYINQQSGGLRDANNDSQSQLTAQNLPQVQAEANEISGDLKVTNQVLSQELDVSGLLRGIGQIMPSGTILDALSLEKVSGAIDLKVSATSYTSAAQVAVNLGDPKNGLFSKIDIININCTAGNTMQYNCTGEFNALFSDTAKTKYLDVAKGTSP